MQYNSTIGLYGSTKWWSWKSFFALKFIALSNMVWILLYSKFLALYSLYWNTNLTYTITIISATVATCNIYYYVLIHIVYACHIIGFPLSNLYVFGFFFNPSVIIKPHAILFAHNIVYSCHIIKFPLLSNLSLSFFLFKCDKKQYSGTNSTYTRHLYLICSLFQ